ncbi:GDP-mannose 4,6-dehydratase [Akkermansiaceae bacterium]|nr:GDP-mannose 4,6-dehydratase [Akkermansiaceae bacterium]
MKILLTGAAGFIGARTTELLIGDGHQIVGIDNMNDYYDVSIKQYRLDQLKKKEGFEFLPLDIEDKEELELCFRNNNFDVVINLAARAGVRYSMENPLIYYTTNVLGGLHLLEAMRRYGVNKYVLASTSSLYAGQTMPFSEDLPVNEPISPYAASKKAAEVQAYTWQKLYGIDVSIVRYFTVYGPAGRPDMSPLRFIKWIDEETPITLYGDGSQARDFTHVDDIARGTIAAMKPLGFEIINLGGGNNPITIKRMIETFETLLDKKAVIDEKAFHAADMRETWADIAKAKRLLDWEPRISFGEGMTGTVNWYRGNRDWLKDIQL